MSAGHTTKLKAIGEYIEKLEADVDRLREDNDRLQSVINRAQYTVVTGHVPCDCRVDQSGDIAVWCIKHSELKRERDWLRKEKNRYCDAWKRLRTASDNFIREAIRKGDEV